MRIKLLGVSGFSPWRSRLAKKFTSSQITWDNKSLQIDIGEKYEGKPIDFLLITHLHYDHVQEISSLPENVSIMIPSLTFLEKLKRKQPKGEFRVFKTKVRLNGLSIKPFPVLHSSTTLTYGLKFYWNTKSFVWLPDWCIIPGYMEIFRDVDYLFLGASALKKAIQHRGYGCCQGAIYPMLKKIDEMKNPPKQIYLIHFGMGMRPIALKTKYLQKEFPNLKIDFTRDNMKLEL